RPLELRRARAHRAQTLLAHFRRRRALRAAGERDIEQGHARLLDEAAKHGERFRSAFRLLAEGADEILGARRAIGMALEKGAHAVPEALRRKPGLEGGEHRRALVVGDAVEGAPD